MSGMCKLCISPYQEEFKRAWDSHFPRKMLWEKYNHLIWGTKGTKYGAFQQAVYKHRDHKDPGVVVLQSKNGNVGKDLNGIVKMITELYSRKVEGMTPEDVSTKDFVAVNKLALEKEKLKLDKNDQLMALAKLFGIPEVINPLDVIAGKELHVEFGPTEDQGHQPQSTQ